MIPVRMQPEPAAFDTNVRKPGQRFLRATPRPKKKQWNGKEFWKEAIMDLYSAYAGICAYCAEWIPRTTGEISVDHFLPKSIHPHLAYEWSNYRLAARRFNDLKQDHTDVVDPFTLQADWFVLDFPSLLVKANGVLAAYDAEHIWKTIKRLHLNDERAIQSRYRWVRDYCENLFGFDYLRRNAPFIAYELERQHLVQPIRSLYP
jgi:hypothetical protein